MKAKRRHELQHNVLDAELGKAVRFLKTRGTHLIWGVLIAAIIVFVIVYVYQDRKSKLRDAQVEYTRLINTNITSVADLRQKIGELEKLTNQDDNESVAARSCVAVGNLIATQCLFSKYTVEPAELQGMAAQASRFYSKAIAQFPDDKLPVAKAHLGLARLAETMGRMDEARTQYEAVRDMNLQGYSVGLLAEGALRRLDEGRPPVRMATTSVATSPSSQPDTLMPEEPNLPGESGQSGD